MGMVFQDPDDQLFMTTVDDDVAFGPRNYQLSEQEVEQRVTMALDLVRIPSFERPSTFQVIRGRKTMGSYCICFINGTGYPYYG